MKQTQKDLVMPRHDSNPSEPDSQQTGRRDFMEIAVAGAAGSIVLAAGGTRASAESQSSEIQALFPEGAPAAAPGYSPGIVASGSRVVFVSGQGPSDLNADMETQIRQTFDRIGLVLKAAGADFKHVVMLRAYFVHMARDLPVYRKVRLDYLSEPYPASTAVGTTELAIPGLEIEIEAVAIVGTSK
jgi:enamine deaminase RidA (YjgF/YER057c/UK114 family)